MSRYLNVLTVGSEVEFSLNCEEDLKVYFEHVNSGNVYKYVLTRKRNKDRFYSENEYIYEYRSPVITGKAYQRFINYYFFVSAFSNDDYVKGYYHDNSGSFHTHFTTDIPIEDLKFNNILVLAPFMARKVLSDYIYFRDAVVDLDDMYSEINTLSCIPEDNKSHWISENSEYGTYEIRLNENIPFWYILLPYINWEKSYSVYRGILSENENYILTSNWIDVLGDIWEAAKKDRENVTMDIKPFQVAAYNNLIDFIEYYLSLLQDRKEVTIRTFFKFFYSNFDKYKNMYKDYKKNIVNLDRQKDYWGA